MKGTVVDSKYEILSCLGQGGMGAVYEARHLGTGRRVAVKMIIPSTLAAGGDIIPRFRREARASGAIDSEHVVQVLDTGVDPQTSRPYLVMECLTGEDLQQLVARVGPLPPDVVLRMFAQACAGLVSAHETGTIHRDIKSANLFVSRREGGDVTIKILDFGIAKVRADPMSSSANQGITATGALLGSPLYMSPEQVLGAKDTGPRSDLFSLGVTMYEALCGVTPQHDCETVGLLIVAITSGRVKPVQDRAPWVSSEVAAIVHRALAADANARYQTAADMQAAIMALLPQGSSLRESMLVGASPEAKNVVSSKLAQMTVPLVTPVPHPQSVAQSLAQPSAIAATGTPLVNDVPVELPMRSGWKLAVPVALVVLLSAAVVIYMQANKPAPAPVLSAEPSAAVSVSAAPLPSMVKDDVDAAIPSASPSSVGVAPSVAPAMVARPRTPVMASAPALVAPPNCDPPYTFNADGKKIWKRECL